MVDIIMCDFADFEFEKTKLKKKIREYEESWEAEPELEKINSDEKTIELTQ
jgi:hypothetical protein